MRSRRSARDAATSRKMTGLAAELATNRAVLDFSTRSLDDLAVIAHGKEDDSEFARGCAAYVGEVLRCELPGARWTWDPKREGDHPFIEANSWLIDPTYQFRRFAQGDNPGGTLRQVVDEIVLFMKNPSNELAQQFGWQDLVVHESAWDGCKRILRQRWIYRRRVKQERS